MNIKQLNTCRKVITLSIAIVVFTGLSFAGNEQRAGQAGASELLINPFARSSGWAGANIAGVQGVESIYLNVAGLSFTDRTELIFSQTSWLQYGKDMFNANESVSSISSFGLAQKIGESATLGFAVMSMNFGEIEITTVDLPDGGIGTFSPRFMNIAVSYSKIFSNSIYGGVTIKMISEQISNLSANGVALDAGIQYVTGKSDNLKFGVALKNIGPRMSFKGDGLSFFNDLDDLMNAHSEPFSTTAIYAQYKVMSLAQNNVKVLLDGQGADELFAGYHYFFGFYFKGLIQSGKFGQVLNELYGAFVNNQYKS